MTELDMLLAGQLRHPRRIELNEKLADLIHSDADKAVITDLALQLIDDVIGGTLTMIEQTDEVSLTFGQTSLTDWIDGLDVLPYGPDGWIEKHSSHPPSPTNRASPGAEP